MPARSRSKWVQEADLFWVNFLLVQLLELLQVRNWTGTSADKGQGVKGLGGREGRDPSTAGIAVTEMAVGLRSVSEHPCAPC